MFLSNDFIYVDLSKTGTVSVINWLKKLNVPLIECQHHVKPSSKQIESDKIKFSTIRDPWSYYLSLWSYGCQKKNQSGPYNSLTRFRPFRHRGFSNNFFGAIKSVGHCLYRSLTENWSRNRHLYSDRDNPKLFQSWLRKMLAIDTSVFLSGSYFSSGIQKFCGLYSYRFCNLYCKNSRQLHGGSLKSIQKLESWLESNLYIDEFLNTGTLREDFVALINKYKFVPEDSDLDCIRPTRMNSSTSADTRISDFYNDETAELVQQREKIIVDRFQYAYSDVA